MILLRLIKSTATFARDCVPSMPRAVWVLQLGTAINMFGWGLILPFEIIYLHDHRGFAVPIAGLVLSTVMASGAAAAFPAGALVDRYGGKRLIALGMTLSAIGYGAMAFVAHPWQGFLASVVAGTGFGLTTTATPALIAALTTREERVHAFSISRVSVNLGIGIGSVTAGFIVADGALSSFQLLYFLDAATFLAVFALLLFVPAARGASSRPAEKVGQRAGYGTVVRDHLFLVLIGANVLFAIVGYSLFGFVMSPYARHQAHVGARGIGAIIGVNTLFIIIAQLPLMRLSRNKNRVKTLGVMTTIWIIACLAAIPAAHLHPVLVATLALAVVGIGFGVGECLHAIVIGPLISDLAPPELMGRYMASFGISVSVGFALGPAIGSGLLALSPSLPWATGATLLLVLFPVLLMLRRRLPDTVQIDPRGERGAERQDLIPAAGPSH